ncbi:hypothetical protein IscW_ISCW006853 [Ixodes scapularis]|uniref:Uncharacterized protein n=1 Tax=Ixodes scapularis TaxID=6945 RepID=B7PMG7_IXOSC|nr:hypothetical protein IscW_ISCW006853 [Ixodes scapularis]|eukprot:XP_002434965.1 hypothetical protein IscW_ISCW006853 [Ixodes scapularis]
MRWEKQFQLGQRLGVCGRASLGVEGAAGVASRTGSEPGRSRAGAGPPRIVVGSAEFRSVDKKHVPHVRTQLPSKRVDRRPRAAPRPDRTRAADDSDPPREPRRGRPGVGTRSGLAHADGADKRDGTMGRQKRGPRGNPGGNTVKHDNHPANNKDKNDDGDVNRSGIQRSSEAEERELARLGTAYTARASAIHLLNLLLFASGRRRRRKSSSFLCMDVGRGWEVVGRVYGAHWVGDLSRRMEPLG